VDLAPHREEYWFLQLDLQQGLEFQKFGDHPYLLEGKAALMKQLVDLGNLEVGPLAVTRFSTSTDVGLGLRLAYPFSDFKFPGGRKAVWVILDGFHWIGEQDHPLVSMVEFGVVADVGFRIGAWGGFDINSAQFNLMLLSVGTDLPL
jgi:hypothetical protein